MRDSISITLEIQSYLPIPCRNGFGLLVVMCISSFFNCGKLSAWTLSIYRQAVQLLISSKFLVIF
jgi:hypothetical protein